MGNETVGKGRNRKSPVSDAGGKAPGGVARVPEKDRKNTAPRTGAGVPKSRATAVSAAKATVSAATVFAKWRKNPAYLQALQNIDAEFSTAAAMIDARMRARLTQAELAQRIGTTQSAVARMESGRYKLSQSTLEKYAEATGSRLRVVFDPLT